MTENKRDRLSLKNPWLYVDMFLLYLFGSLLGVVLEGLWSVITLGHWETHVVSMYAPLCVIYGFGAAFFYAFAIYSHKKNIFIQFLISGAVGTVLELIIGLLILYILKMRAWDYTNDWLNYKGVICPLMFLVWGILGVIFGLVFKPLSWLLAKAHKKVFAVLAIVLGFLLILDLIYCCICIVRWKDRHFGKPAANEFEQMLDEQYPDEFMQDRFIEWKFVE